MLMKQTYHEQVIDGLAYDYSISSALALKIPQ